MVYAWHLVFHRRVLLARTKDLSFFIRHSASCTTDSHTYNRRGFLECTDPFSGVTERIRAPRSRLDLLKVSTQVHDEALQVFCSKNRFQFMDLDHMDRIIAAWPRRVQLLKQVTFTFETPPPHDGGGWSRRLFNFQALENLQLLLDYRNSATKLNSGRNLTTARGMDDFMLSLRGIKKLQMVGRDQLTDAHNIRSMVDVNQLEAVGPAIRAKFMRPKLVN